MLKKLIRPMIWTLLFMHTALASHSEKKDEIEILFTQTVEKKQGGEIYRVSIAFVEIDGELIIQGQRLEAKDQAFWYIEEGEVKVMIHGERQFTLSDFDF